MPVPRVVAVFSTATGFTGAGAGVNANVPAGGGRLTGVVFCATVSPVFTSGASGSCIFTFVGNERAAAI